MPISHSLLWPRVFLRFGVFRGLWMASDHWREFTQDLDVGIWHRQEAMDKGEPVRLRAGLG